MTGFIGEFFGTMIMIVFGIGAGAAMNLKHSYAQKSNWLFISIAWGLAITFGVYVAGSLGSEGHLNPAVTLAFALFKHFPLSKVGTYILAQVLGAFVGSVLVIIQYSPHFKASKTAEDGNHVGIFGTGPAIDNPIFNLLSETISTFIFIFTLLNLGDFTKGIKPLICGLLVMVLAMALGGTTGLALNPARDWMPRLAYTIVPIPHKGSANWKYAWVPLIGPTLGALIAAGLDNLVK